MNHVPAAKSMQYGFIRTALFLATLICSVITPVGAALDVSFADGIYATFSLEITEVGSGLRRNADVEVTNANLIPSLPGSGPNWEYDGDFSGGFATLIVLGGGVDIFGVAEILSRGETDPWSAFRISITNLRDVAARVDYEGRFLTVDMVGNSDVEAILDVSVLDTSGDGSASFATSFAAFEAWNFSEFDFVRYPGTGVVPDLNIMAGETIRQIAVSATIAPMFGSSPLFNELEFLGNGIISPGDTFILEGFTCIVSSGGSCPAPPDLNTVVPIPAALWLFGSALAGLGWSRRKKI